MYGNLAEAALRCGRESEYVIYAFAQTLKQSPGNNGVPKRELIDQLAVHDVFTSAAYARMLLERGNGCFWGLGDDRVWLRSPKLVAHQLDARRTGAHRQAVGTARLRSRKMRRGALLSAALPVGKPIRQETIRRLSSVSARTQRRYRRAGHFAVRRQDAVLSAAFVRSDSPAIRRVLAFSEREHGVYVTGLGAVPMKRLPNEYFPLGTRIPRGRRSKELFAAQPLQIVADGDRAVPRTFFDRPEQWVRCRRLRLGTDGGAKYAYPYNLAYVRAGHNRWEAIAA